MAEASGPRPGNLDRLNVAKGLFPSDGPYGIPALLSYEGSVPEVLIPYRRQVRTKEPVRDAAVHFFLDDSVFEPVWSRTLKGLQYVSRFGLALSPDFSLYAAFPLALQLFNVYRNRWVGRFWQERGLGVIPTVSWSDERSYPFCFAGVPRGSPVAISTVGLGARGETDRLKKARALFASGYAEMVERIEPPIVLVYGEVPPERLGVAPNLGPPTKTYPSRWQGIRAARAAAAARKGPQPSP